MKNDFILILFFCIINNPIAQNIIGTDGCHILKFSSNKIDTLVTENFEILNLKIYNNKNTIYFVKSIPLGNNNYNNLLYEFDFKSKKCEKYFRLV